MSNQNSSGSSFWGFIKALGLIAAILGGIAEFSGKNISKWIDKTFGTAEKINCIAPNVIGKSENVAVLELKQMGFEITQKKVYNNSYNTGIVISQYPLPNEEIENCEGKFYLETSAAEQDNNKIIRNPSVKTIENEAQESKTAGILRTIFLVIFGIFGLYFLYKLFDLVF